MLFCRVGADESECGIGIGDLGRESDGYFAGRMERVRCLRKGIKVCWRLVEAIFEQECRAFTGQRTGDGPTFVI